VVVPWLAQSDRQAGLSGHTPWEVLGGRTYFIAVRALYLAANTYISLTTNTPTTFGTPWSATNVSWRLEGVVSFNARAGQGPEGVWALRPDGQLVTQIQGGGWLTCDLIEANSFTTTFRWSIDDQAPVNSSPGPPNQWVRRALYIPPGQRQIALIRTVRDRFSQFQPGMIANVRFEPGPPPPPGLELVRPGHHSQLWPEAFPADLQGAFSIYGAGASGVRQHLDSKDLSESEWRRWIGLEPESVGWGSDSLNGSHHFYRSIYRWSLPESGWQTNSSTLFRVVVEPD
jgi:hypothetical protein